MGKPTGFKEIPREMPKRRPVELRILDWNEIYNPFPDDKLRAQGARCMDCGIPFCHQGCPLGNIIPEWNDWFTKIGGARPSICCTRPTTSRNGPGESARRR